MHGRGEDHKDTQRSLRDGTSSLGGKTARVESTSVKVKVFFCTYEFGESQLFAFLFLFQ